LLKNDEAVKSAIELDDKTQTVANEMPKQNIVRHKNTRQKKI